MSEVQDYDVAVIGSGAAGLSAAIFAALAGARTVLIERTDYIGGTTAYSAGTTWAPNTRLAATVGATDNPDKVLGFLDRAVGNRSPRAMREAFVENAPKAIHTLMDRTEAQFRACPRHPDYLSEIEGSTLNGRALEPVPFNGSALGADLALVRPPIPEFTILGGLMVDRTDIAHLLGMTKSLKSLAYSIKLVSGFLRDKLRHGRSARLVMGNALIGRLLLSARQAGVTIRTQTTVTDIQTGSETLLSLKSGETLRIKGGVILATGGFGRHPTRRAEMLPTPTAEHSPAAPGHTGELHDIALRLGATYGDGAQTNAFWAPVSTRQRPDGTWAVFPHFVFDRSKPGIIAVGKDGKRFTNESRSYHEFAQAQQATGTLPAYLVTDANGLKTYGLGMVRPGGMGAKALLKDGYLTEAPTLDALAQRLGIDAAGLKDTAQRMNRFAETGVDQDFHRGETDYERHNGDANHGPNPTLGKIGTGPFYAVKLMPGDIGAATGLRTDETARLLDKDGTPIPGLYAAGNDMQSIMGGVYPGPGITIGPAITFGFIAATHASERAKA
ncbi:FAD-dependent oxidoreductase [Pseudoprimorskyibacter insulae]|uniref:3-oxosteroid 1-dehydrogenase n=1 Tax=Pseudoprimorskyibacter insulae TaxID=1695997 RepID=A0A2R8AY56_9RHOB|nr:FAD-dependent oxidoreductase [Pseudoprimorskyibacter insulae]SPF80917.1 3-oxosteroid 1-dehydrogenase [Pseudoprimorskyibacter insulae]